MKTFIRIVADTNDGDYIDYFDETTEEQLAFILPVIEAIKKFKPYKSKTESGSEWTHRCNWVTGECHRKDLGEKSPNELYVKTGMVTQTQFDAFAELVPFGEHGVHSIKTVEILKVESVETLYKHKYEN